MCAHYEKCARQWVLLRMACVHTMKNVHVHEYCLGWHVYAHYPYWTGQCNKEEKESFTDISQWRLLNKDQRNVSLFLISTKTRTAPFKKNGPIALTTGRDVCEVFWKQYFNQRRNWHHATSWEKATCGTTYCHTSSGQQHSDRLQYQKTAIQCKSLVHREGVDDNLRRGHEKTVPVRRESPGPPWSGGRRPEERTREDSANQTRVSWSTVKWWMTTWGEDTRRQWQSDVSPLVYREVVDDDLRSPRTLHREQKDTDEVRANNYSWVVKLSTQTVSVTQNWPFLNLKIKVMKSKVRLGVVSI